MDGSMAVGSAMGISNRGAMPPAPGQLAPSAPPGPATMVPDGALGLTPPTTERFGQAATMGGIRSNWWNLLHSTVQLLELNLLQTNVADTNKIAVSSFPELLKKDPFGLS